MLTVKHSNVYTYSTAQCYRREVEREIQRENSGTIEIKLEAVLLRAQVSARCGFVVVGVHYLLMSEVAIDVCKRVAFVP